MPCGTGSQVNSALERRMKNTGLVVSRVICAFCAQYFAGLALMKACVALGPKSYGWLGTGAFILLPTPMTFGYYIVPVTSLLLFSVFRSLIRYRRTP